MAIISRGFTGRHSTADVRLPPGQYVTTDFPVLSAGPAPHVSLDQWEFTNPRRERYSAALGLDDNSDVLLRLVNTPHRMWLDMGGMTFFRFDAPEIAAPATGAETAGTGH
jgi:hypothetical protein